VKNCKSVYRFIVMDYVFGERAGVGLAMQSSLYQDIV